MILKKILYQIFKKSLSSSLHWYSSESVGAGKFAIYVTNSIGDKTEGNGNRFCATSIIVNPKDHTSADTLYGKPRIRSG
jgi:hypothetical protein